MRNSPVISRSSIRGESSRGGHVSSKKCQVTRGKWLKEASIRKHFRPPTAPLRSLRRSEELLSEVVRLPTPTTSSFLHLHRILGVDEVEVHVGSHGGGQLAVLLHGMISSTLSSHPAPT